MSYGNLEVRGENQAKESNPQDSRSPTGSGCVNRSPAGLEAGEASRGWMANGLECHTKELALQAVGDEECHGQKGWYEGWGGGRDRLRCPMWARYWGPGEKVSLREGGGPKIPRCLRCQAAPIGALRISEVRQSGVGRSLEANREEQSQFCHLPSVWPWAT